MPVAVSIVPSGGLPVTQVAGNAAAFTVWDSGGLPISLGNSGLPVVLLNPDGSAYSTLPATAILLESGDNLATEAGDPLVTES